MAVQKGFSQRNAKDVFVSFWFEVQHSTTILFQVEHAFDTCLDKRPSTDPKRKKTFMARRNGNIEGCAVANVPQTAGVSRQQKL